VAYRHGSATQHEYEALDQRSKQWTLKAKSCPTWLLGNDGEAGYYRVEYRGDLLRRLLTDRASELSVAERVGVLGDINALVDSGAEPPAEALALIQPFGQDPDWRVVSQSMRETAILRGDMVPPELRPNAARFLDKMFGARARELGWIPKPSETSDTRALRRTLLILVAADAEDPQLLNQARTLALKWLENHSAVDAGIADVVLDAAASHGDQELFDKIRAAALKSQSHRERQMLVGALAEFRDPAIIRQRLALLLTGEFDPRESFQALLFSAPPAARRLPFEFVRANFDALTAKLPRDVGEDYAAQLSAVGNGFCDASGRANIESFFGPKAAQWNGGKRILDQTLERIDVCIAHKAALGSSLEQFLKNY